MLSLEEFYKNYENSLIVEREGDVFDIDYNDGALKKMFKKFFNWFLGSAEKSSYDPFSKDFNKDATDEVLDELRKDGEKFEIVIKEINTFEEFKAGVDKAVEFLNIKQALENKKIINKWKEHKFGCVQMEVKNVIENRPVVMFAYRYAKDKVCVDLIEGLEPFASNIYIKDFLTKLKSFLKKQIKKDKVDLSKFSIRIVRLSKHAGWSFNNLLEFMANNAKDFERFEKEESDKNIERIFVSKL